MSNITTTTLLRNFNQTTESLKELQSSLQPFLEIIKNKNPEIDAQTTTEAEAAAGLSLGTLRFVLSRLDNGTTLSNEDNEKIKGELGKFRSAIVKLKGKRQNETEKDVQKTPAVQQEDKAEDKHKTKPIVIKKKRQFDKPLVEIEMDADDADSDVSENERSELRFQQNSKKKKKRR